MRSFCPATCSSHDQPLPPLSSALWPRSRRARVQEVCCGKAAGRLVAGDRTLKRGSLAVGDTSQTGGRTSLLIASFVSALCTALYRRPTLNSASSIMTVQPDSRAQRTSWSVSDAPPSYESLQELLRPLPAADKTPSTPSPTKSPDGPAPHDPSAGEWIFTRNRRAADIRKTVLEVLRDLVKKPDTHNACTLLDACAAACTTNKQSLSTLLQEKSIESHTPLYWSIINKPACFDDGPDLISLLISHAVPLTAATVDDVRLACLHTSDNALFQRLRSSSEFAPLSGKEEIVAGGSKSMDVITVENPEHDDTAFVVRFRVPMFQKRMRVSEEVRLEFIAKGQLWELTFLIAKDSDKRLNYDARFMGGTWVVKLALLHHSTPTYIDSTNLCIEDPLTRRTAAAKRRSKNSQAESAASRSNQRWKPCIRVALQSNHQLTVPSSPQSYDCKMVAVSFASHTVLVTLQFPSCPWLESDGTLDGRLQGRVARPQNALEPETPGGCIVC
ncbi:hypothetical protein C8Q76DRAFT_709217 [Earliella scabrosa]|nr:hypothetical protein C8Q76DRAFT_709217 [Earliella scabrosa]